MDLATLGLAVDSRQVKDGTKALDEFGKKASDTSKKLGGFEQQARKTGEGVKRAIEPMEAFKRVAISLGAALSARQLISYADTMTTLNSRVKLVTGSQALQKQVMEELVGVSRRGQAAFADTVQIYARMALASKTLGLSQREVLNMTETLQKTFVISGATTMEAASAAIQLAQAMGSGRLQGDELRSTLENNQRFAIGLAKSLGVDNVQALRTMAAEGKITSEQLAIAIKDMQAEVDKEMKNMAYTVSRAGGQAADAFMRYVGAANEASGSTGFLAKALLGVADNMDILVPLVGALATAYVATLVPAIWATTAAFLSSPLGIMAAILGGIAAAVIYASDKFGGFQNVVDAGKQTLMEYSTTIMNLGNTMGAFFQGVLAEGSEMFRILGDLFKAFKSDLKAFFDSPIQSLRNGSIFGGLDTAIQQGKGYSFGAAYHKEMERAKKENEERNATLQRSIALLGQENSALDKNTLNKKGNASTTKQLTDEEKKLVKERAELLSDLNFEIPLLERRLEAYKTSLAYGKLIDEQIAIENALRKVGLTVGTAEARQYEEKLRLREKLKSATDTAIEQAKEEQKNLERALELQREPYLEAARNIQNAFGDMFENIFTKGVDSFSDLAKQIKAIMFKAAAQIAAAMVFRPVFGSMLGSIAPSIAKELGYTSGAGGSSFSLMGTLSNLNGLMSGVNGGLFGGFGASLDAWGAANLGLANVSPSFVGALPAGQTAGLTMSGLLSSAGLGAGLGGLITMFTGGNQIGGSLGGAAGAILGNFLLPGVGGWIGGALGGGLGGLFGNSKPSSKLQAGVVDLASGQITARDGLTGKKFSQENYDAVTQLSQITSGLAQALGITGSISVAKSDRYGFEYAMGDNIGAFFGGSDPTRRSFGSANEYFEGLLKDFQVNFPEKFNDALNTAMENIDFGKGQEALEKALSDVVFALNFDKLGDMVKPANAYEDALKELNKQYDEAAATAKRLGLSEEKVQQAREKQISYIREQFEREIMSALNAELNPAANALAELNKTFEDLRRSAAAVGADTTRLEQLYDLKLQQILFAQITQQQVEGAQNQITLLNQQANAYQQAYQSFQKLAESIGKFRQGLLFSNLSTLSPDARLAEARRVFETTATRALGGDEKALTVLNDASQTLLEESRSYYNSSLGYQQDFARVQQVLTDAERTAKVQSDLQKAGYDNAMQQTTILQNILDTLQGKAANSNQTLFEGKAMDAAGRSFSDIAYKNLSYYETATIGRSLGYTGEYGLGGHVAWRNADTTGQRDRDFIAALERAAAAKSKMQGFASGGITPVNQPFIVGERGAEIMMPLSQSMQVIPNHRLANDNSDLVSELRAQNELLRRGFLMMQEKFDTLNSEYASMRRAAERKAA